MVDRRDRCSFVLPSYNAVRSPARAESGTPNRSFTITTEAYEETVVPCPAPLFDHNQTHPPSAERRSRPRTPAARTPAATGRTPVGAPLLRADQRVRRRSGSGDAPPPPRPPAVPKIVAFGRTTPVFVPEKPPARPATMPLQPQLQRLQPKPLAAPSTSTAPLTATATQPQRAFALTRASSLQRPPPPTAPHHCEQLKRLVEQLVKENVESGRRFDRLHDENEALRRQVGEMRAEFSTELERMREELDEMRRHASDSHYHPSQLFSHTTRSVNQRLQAIENRNKRDERDERDDRVELEERHKKDDRDDRHKRDDRAEREQREVRKERDRRDRTDRRANSVDPKENPRAASASFSPLSPSAGWTPSPIRPHVKRTTDGAPQRARTPQRSQRPKAPQPQRAANRKPPVHNVERVWHAQDFDWTADQSLVLSGDFDSPDLFVTSK
ncbi:hypothetical protein M3Y99_00892400 [Aphelenchoides fujianensis]|nr:hypothetical protein M3Y99_00892400 [Aphelenchoides fujianensis]